MEKNKKLPWLETNLIMGRAGFSSEMVRHSQIWAAKHRECEKCTAGPYEACRNLIGVKNLGFALARINVMPHTERIDYDKLKKALNERGYK